MPDERLALSPRVVAQLLVVAVVFPALPLPISGDWRWWEAWASAALLSSSFVLSRGLAARKHPDLLAERARMLDHPDTKPFDRVLAPIVASGLVVVLVVAGVEHRLAPSSPVPAGARWGALLPIALGYALGSWALLENRFFSGVVRIQRDRGHEVVSTGPYRYVRHPGYAGGLVAYLATPVALGSVWALAPAVVASVALVLRTSLEDQTLRAELDGYEAYAARTRFRLLPGVW